MIILWVVFYVSKYMGKITKAYLELAILKGLLRTFKVLFFFFNFHFYYNVRKCPLLLLSTNFGTEIENLNSKCPRFFFSDFVTMFSGPY